MKSQNTFTQTKQSLWDRLKYKSQFRHQLVKQMKLHSNVEKNLKKKLIIGKHTLFNFDRNQIIINDQNNKDDVSKLDVELDKIDIRIDSKQYE